MPVTGRVDFFQNAGDAQEPVELTITDSSVCHPAFLPIAICLFPQSLYIVHSPRVNAMISINRYFDFSPAQLKVLMTLTLTALCLTGYLLVRSYATPTTTRPALPVILGDSEIKFTGLFVLDPNTAPADSLELLPGIGRTLADRIVEYRATHRFTREIDITEVRGVGPKLYEQIKPYLRVNR